MRNLLRWRRFMRPVDVDPSHDHNSDHDNFSDRLQQVDDRLRADVAASRLAPSSALRRRTIAALNDASRETFKAPKRLWRVRLVSVTLGLALVISAGLAVRSWRDAESPSDVVTAKPMNPAEALDDLVRMLSTGAAELTIPVELSLVEERRAMVADLRDARNYLVSRVPFGEQIDEHVNIVPAAFWRTEDED